MITIDYFSDVLCVWAYGGQVRLDELQQVFGDRVCVRHRFLSLFADTRTRIAEGWADRGGFDGFGEHTQEVCRQWPHTRLHGDVWTRCRPVSCTTAHVFLKAVAISLGIEQASCPGAAETARFDRLAREVRAAFFEHGRDIAALDVLLTLLDDDCPAAAEIRAVIDRGEAYAALQRDLVEAERFAVTGSPTYVFNEGRQLLYGNVGYRIIEANVRELLARPEIAGEPSLC